MKNASKKRFLILWGCLLVCMLVGILLIPGQEKHETIKEVMRDAVLHEENKVSLFGIKDVNPALISAFTVTGVLLVAAALIRILVIPKFKNVPGKFQLALETLVGLFDGLAKSNSPHRNGFLGVYLFSAGVFIFVSTVFELFGIQVTTTHGIQMAMPAPLSDINAAIMMGCLSYFVIMSGGIAGNGVGGIGKTLKEFSLPISMSFRLFGALLSGLMVTELVYFFKPLSFVLPVVVGVMFTLLHALIQAYVLTMLTALYYGEVSEHHEKVKKEKKKKANKEEQAVA